MGVIIASQIVCVFLVCVLIMFSISIVFFFAFMCAIIDVGLTVLHL